METRETYTWLGLDGVRWDTDKGAKDSEVKRADRRSVGQTAGQLHKGVNVQACPMWALPGVPPSNL